MRMTTVPPLPLRTLGQAAGRALFIDAQGTFYVGRSYQVWRSGDMGKSWCLDCQAPDVGWKSVAAKHRLAARVLRRYIAALQVLGDGARVAVVREGICRAEPGETELRPVFSLTRGSRPIHLTAHDQRLLFGEYGSLQDTEVRIYVSDDGGRSFAVGYCFPRGDIRHVHNIVYDPYREHYWILVGDFGHQPGIGALSKNLDHIEWLQRGSQRVRAVGLLVEPDRLLYGTDSDRERNFIVSMEKNTGRVTTIREVEGSSLFAARFGAVRLVSTCVEPNPACRSRQATLYASSDGDTWSAVMSVRKDFYHMVYFQFGTLVLPISRWHDSCGIVSGQAVRGMDAQMVVVRFD